MGTVLVRHDGDGKIDGVSRMTLNPDPGYTEQLPDDDPEVLAFEAGPPEPPTIAEVIDAMDGVAKGDNTKLYDLKARIDG